MKKLFLAFAALVALISCQDLKEEWQPVVSDNEDPEEFIPYTEARLKACKGLESFTTIQDLKAMYKNKPLEISGNIWIRGQVISSDVTGNVYRELYIQDKTGGIDLKLGKSSLYSEFSLGQWVYVHCDGLTLGAYNGMPQLGLEADKTSTNEYETSYIDLQVIIDQHVYRGVQADPLEPIEVTEEDVKASLAAGFTGELWGKLVTVKGVSYGDQIFALFYPNSNLPHKSSNPENRVFLSDNGTWGITTWACSKTGYVRYLENRCWDEAVVGSGNTKYGEIARTTPRSAGLSGTTLQNFSPYEDTTYKDIMIQFATANYVSHYFKLGSTDIQVRTSGYAKFADTELDPALRDGSKTADITGIMTIYSGAAQFTLVDDPSVSVVLN